MHTEARDCIQYTLGGQLGTVYNIHWGQGLYTIYKGPRDCIQYTRDLGTVNKEARECTQGSQGLYMYNGAGDCIPGSQGLYTRELGTVYVQWSQGLYTRELGTVYKEARHCIQGSQGLYIMYKVTRAQWFKITTLFYNFSYCWEMILNGQKKHKKFQLNLDLSFRKYYFQNLLITFFG